MFVGKGLGIVYLGAMLHEKKMGNAFVMSMTAFFFVSTEPDN